MSRHTTFAAAAITPSPRSSDKSPRAPYSGTVAPVTDRLTSRSTTGPSPPRRSATRSTTNLGIRRASRAVRSISAASLVLRDHLEPHPVERGVVSADAVHALDAGTLPADERA